MKHISIIDGELELEGYLISHICYGHMVLNRHFYNFERNPICSECKKDYTSYLPFITMWVKLNNPYEENQLA